MNTSKTTTKIYDRLLEPLLKNLKQKMALMIKSQNAYPIIDLCCGTGKQCSYYSETGKTCGLDLDPHMTSFASQKYKHIPFVLADASLLPLKKNYFKSASISLALHDKSVKERKEIVKSAKSVVGSSGYVVLMDFENPWSTRSKIGYVLVYLVELFAGLQHFKNGRQFLKNGGLTQFVLENDLVIVDRYNSEGSCTAIVVTKPKS